MSSYGSRIPHYLEGKNEEEVRVKLGEIGITTQQKLELVTIYHNTTKNRVIAWYFHDLKSNVPLPPTGSKKTKKKISKKASNG